MRLSAEVLLTSPADSRCDGAFPDPPRAYPFDLAWSAYHRHLGRRTAVSRPGDRRIN